MKHLTVVSLVTVATGAANAQAIESEDSVRNNVIGSAQMTVEGEIRTVDDAGQLLWGKGRAGVARYGTTGVESGLCRNFDETIEFGLSNIYVQWADSAHACPAGTWVCRSGVDGHIFCDTTRPDALEGDYFDCDGSAMNADYDAHPGWLADATGVGGSHPFNYATENGGGGAILLPCSFMPVWCCSEVPPP